MKWILIFVLFIVQAKTQNQDGTTKVLGEILGLLSKMTKAVDNIKEDVGNNKLLLAGMKGMLDDMNAGGDYMGTMIYKNYMMLSNIHAIVELLNNTITDGGIDCKTMSCENGGTCLNIGLAEMCMCLPGYTGKICETVEKACTNKSCKNGGTCFVMGKKEYCMCPKQFTGYECEVEIVATTEAVSQTTPVETTLPTTEPTTATPTDPCESKPCENGGTCFGMGKPYDYICVCLDGSVGKSCKITTPGGEPTTTPKPTIDPNYPCKPETCKNGGTCIGMGKPDKHVCICVDGYVGKDCEKTTPKPPKPTIDPTKSCQGFCNSGGGPSSGCYCDQQCLDYGDCCEDYQSLCVNKPAPKRVKRSSLYTRKSYERMVKK